ncbi:MAG: hypothetical protein RLZZ241_1669 [Bacteroidota bacterium]
MFLNLGFKSVTMDDLALQMGISKKTIYTHFANKTELVEQSSLYVFSEISSGVNTICNQQMNPIEELYEVKKFALVHLKNEKASPQYQLRKYYPKIHNQIMQKTFDMMQDCVLLNIKRGIEMGMYRENLDPEFVSRIYFAGVNSIKDDTLFPRPQFPLVHLNDIYLEYHLRGIVTPKGRNVLNKIINSNHE